LSDRTQQRKQKLSHVTRLKFTRKYVYLPANVQKSARFLILIQFKKHGIVDSKKALEIVEKLQERGFRVAEEILMQTIDGFEIILALGRVMSDEKGLFLIEKLGILQFELIKFIWLGLNRTTPHS
jgi:hypothetical protein